MCLKKWIISLFAAVVLSCTAVEVSIAHDLPDADITGRGGDFTLHSADGPVSLRQLRGKVVLLFFGYTSCVDVCPMTLWTLSKVLSALTEEELDEVATIFVSLDPNRETPEVLRKYTRYFHGSIIGVTDRREVLHKLIEDYGVAYERKEDPGTALGYVIYHTADILVVDQQGMLLHRKIPFSASPTEIIDEIRELLSSTQ